MKESGLKANDPRARQEYYKGRVVALPRDRTPKHVVRRKREEIAKREHEYKRLLRQIYDLAKRRKFDYNEVIKFLFRNHRRRENEGMFGGIGPSAESKAAAARNPWLKYLRVTSGLKMSTGEKIEDYHRLKDDGELDDYLEKAESLTRERYYERGLSAVQRRRDTYRKHKGKPDRLTGKKLEDALEVERDVMAWAKRMKIPYGEVLKNIKRLNKFYKKFSSEF